MAQANNIQAEGARYLFKTLEHNTVLTSLNIQVWSNCCRCFRDSADQPTPEQCFGPISFASTGSSLDNEQHSEDTQSQRKLLPNCVEACRGLTKAVIWPPWRGNTSIGGCTAEKLHSDQT